MNETGLEPAIVFHPQGAVVPGVYARSEHDATNPPAGWFWDAARGLLAPALGRGYDRNAGHAAQAQLDRMEWMIDPLPGITPNAATHSTTCLDTEDDVARLEAVAVARRGDSAAMEINGAVWVLLPQAVSDAVSNLAWERTRRYLLEDALFAGNPALDSLPA